MAVPRSEMVFAAEPLIRLGAFTLVLATMLLWEGARPRRQMLLGRARRWPGNLGLVVIDALAVRLLIPLCAAGMAMQAERHGFGLFNLIGAPGWIAVPASFLLLDLLIYLQHWTFHAVPLLWRLHRMHHADIDFDTTSGVRFHPVEILLSMLLKLAAVALLGAPAIAVVAFEVVLNATSLFNHGNVSLPGWLDRLVRQVLVTPDMHRVHHSVLRQETDSNFGFNLAWWDRIFGTYVAQPAAGHDRMTIGLPEFRAPGEERLDRMLLQPLRET